MCASVEHVSFTSDHSVSRLYRPLRSLRQAPTPLVTNPAVSPIALMLLVFNTTLAFFPFALPRQWPSPPPLSARRVLPVRLHHSGGLAVSRPSAVPTLVHPLHQARVCLCRWSSSQSRTSEAAMLATCPSLVLSWVPYPSLPHPPPHSSSPCLGPHVLGFAVPPLSPLPPLHVCPFRAPCPDPLPRALL